MPTNIDECLTVTKIGDDIDMLVNLVSQLRDIDKNNILTEAVVQIPDPTIHQKYWRDINICDLCDALERKYMTASRVDIPKDFTTSF